MATNLNSKRIPIRKAVRSGGEYPYYGASGIVDYVADYIFDDDNDSNTIKGYTAHDAFDGLLIRRFTRAVDQPERKAAIPFPKRGWLNFATDGQQSQSVCYPSSYT